MILLLGVIVAAWFALYNLIQPFADWLTYTLLHLQTGSHLGQSVDFFLYDVPKIMLLLSGMIFLISILRTFFSPERTRALLGGKRLGLSLPETIILRRVLKPQLIAVFVGTVAIAIIITGYLFNLIM
jgi:uncharacterized membrane protein YraQ (UPF0718 family)